MTLQRWEELVNSDELIYFWEGCVASIRARNVYCVGFNGIIELDGVMGKVPITEAFDNELDCAEFGVKYKIRHYETFEGAIKGEEDEQHTDNS